MKKKIILNNKNDKIYKKKIQNNLKEMKNMN